MKEMKSIGKVQKMYDVLEGIIKSDIISRSRRVEKFKTDDKLS